jgi:hypothetical protein
MHWVAFSLASLAAAVASGGPNNPEWTEADTRIAACFSSVDKDSAIAIVNGKYPRRDPSLAQLNDKSVSTDKEADQLKVRMGMVARCRAMRIEAVSRFYPSLMPSYRILYFQADQLFEYLRQKWITYGEANRLSKLSQSQFRDRESAYFSLSIEQDRLALSKSWSNMLGMSTCRSATRSNARNLRLGRLRARLSLGWPLTCFIKSFDHSGRSNEPHPSWRMQ